MSNYIFWPLFCLIIFANDYFMWNGGFKDGQDKKHAQYTEMFTAHLELDKQQRSCFNVAIGPMCQDDKGVHKSGIVSLFRDLPGDKNDPFAVFNMKMEYMYSCDCDTGEVLEDKSETEPKPGEEI